MTAQFAVAIRDLHNEQQKVTSINAILGTLFLLSI